MKKQKRPTEPMETFRGKNVLFPSLNPTLRKRAEKKKKQKRKKVTERNDWIHADVTMLSPSQLKAGLKSLSQSVKRNINALEFHNVEGMTSPAITFLEQNGGDITHGGDIDELRDQFAKAQSFMKMPEHTVAGYQKWVQSNLNAVESVFSFDSLTEEEQKDRLNYFWYGFNRIKQAYPWLFIQPHRATDIIDATKEEILNNPNIQSAEDAYLEIEKYIQEEEQNLPSALKSKKTYYDAPNVYGRTFQYTADAVDADILTLTRGDMRTKEFRSSKYKK